MCTIVDCRSSQLGSATMLRCSATMPRCLAPLLRYQAVWSPPIFTACVCDLCRVRVLVRLSHPRPPDRSQHGCPWVSCPDPPVCSRCPGSCIGRRAPTRAVLRCVVHVVWIVSSLRLLDSLSHPSSTWLRLWPCRSSGISHHLWLIVLAVTTDLRL